LNILKRLKALIEQKDRKKLVENIVIIVVIGIIIIIAGGTFLNGTTTAKKDNGAQAPMTVGTAANTLTTFQNDTEGKLKLLLSQMMGVGNVDVMVTYLAGKESIPALDVKKNESSTEEKDNGGGTRNISQSEYNGTVVFEQNQGGEKMPVIIKELQPVVKGVVIVADGAGSPEVKERIIEAVRVLLDVPAHKVSVVERKKQ
jgi:stage III sporulation protein AG